MEKNREKIAFKPITSGLGFHPFSDGLPYAPVSHTVTKNKAPQQPAPAIGTGAVAAGRPSFATTLPPNVKVTRPKIDVPVATAVTAQATATSVTQAPVAPNLLVDPGFGFVYLLKRLFAYAIDSTLNTALLGTTFSFVLVSENIQPELLLNAGVVLITGLFVILFNWALITAQEIVFHTSVGKRIFGLALQGGTSGIFLRAFFFIPSAGFMGAGLLWSLIDRKRRCWHDLVVELQPIEIARL